MFGFPLMHKHINKLFNWFCATLCMTLSFVFASATLVPNVAVAREEMQATKYEKAIIKALILQDIERLNMAFDLAGSQLGAALAQTHKDIIHIKVGDLASQYKENELEAEANYKGKWLIVTGIVSTLDTVNNPPVLQIRGEEPAAIDVLAFFKNPRNEDPFFSTLQLNQPITLMCHGVERTPSPTLQKCEFLDSALEPIQKHFENRLINAVEGKGNLQQNAIWAFTILRIEELLGPEKEKVCEESPAECLNAINHINPATASKTMPKRFFELGYTEKMLTSGRTGLN